MKGFLIKLLIIAVIVGVVLVGTWPLSWLGTFFGWLQTGCNWLAKILNFFGWNGVLKN